MQYDQVVEKHQHLSFVSSHILRSARVQSCSATPTVSRLELSGIRGMRTNRPASACHPGAQSARFHEITGQQTRTVTSSGGLL